MSCEYCRGEKPLTDKIYDDGSKFDDLHGTRIERFGTVPTLSSYVPEKYFTLFKGFRFNESQRRFMSCKWAVGINFCPMCGTPLTGSKPLTVEELREINKEPLKHWVWIETLVDATQRHSLAFSGYYRTSSDYTNGEAFCCGYPGMGYSWDYCDYGKTWLAYDRKPKEEQL